MSHGLNLGHIPFPPSHTPDTPSEERRRKRDHEVADGAKIPASPPLQRKWDPGLQGRSSHNIGLSIRPDTFGPQEVQFLLGSIEARMGRSFAASAASHVLGGILLVFMISLVPERAYEVEINRRAYNIVWIPQEGPGGGGGGGGNESLELPAQVQLEGSDDAELSVPVEEPPDYVELETAPEEQPLETQDLSIPAVLMAAAIDTRPGVLDGLMAASVRSQGTGQDGGAGAGRGGGIGPGQGDGLGPGQGGGVGGGTYRLGTDISPPRLLREVKPQYTAEAMRAKIQGTVLLEVVVLPDGTVGDARITKSLDPIFGLDEEAIKAARKWQFEPGTRFGQPVAVLVGLELYFTLR